MCSGCEFVLFCLTRPAVIHRVHWNLFRQDKKSRCSCQGCAGQFRNRKHREICQEFSEFLVIYLYLWDYNLFWKNIKIQFWIWKGECFRRFNVVFEVNRFNVVLLVSVAWTNLILHQWFMHPINKEEIHNVEIWETLLLPGAPDAQCSISSKCFVIYAMIPMWELRVD
jgi:hypothetical protein